MGGTARQQSSQLLQAVRAGAQAAQQSGHQPGPDPGQQEQRGARQHDQRAGEVQLVRHRPSALEGEAGPAMRGVPGQHGAEQRQRKRQRRPGLRARKPAPVRGAGQQIQRGTAQAEHGGVFRQQGEPGTGARAEPPTPATLGRQGAHQAAGGAEQGAHERPVRQHPSAGGDAKHRCQIQRHRCPQPGLRRVGHRAQAVDEKGGEGKQRHEGQAHRDGLLAAQ